MLEREEIEAAKPHDRKVDRTLLTGLAQSALKADAVTSDPNWDTFLSYIQRAIEWAKQERAQTLALIASPQMVNAEKVAAARNLVFQLDERIRSLEWVITMPAEIKRVGSIAKDKLAEMEVADAEGETADAA